jgi:hypothetical protein
MFIEAAAGTPPIEPAPMVMTTSRSSAARRMVSGMAAMSSTNKGSTFPGEANRAGERAAVGGRRSAPSPAA